METDGYTNVLSARLEELRIEIAEQQKKVQGLFEIINQMQNQAQHIIELLRAEGIHLDKSDLESLGQISISDLAYQYLENNNSHQPIHYRELTNAIMADGNLISGKDPAANLLSHIGRDERFVRVSSGTYGLTEWGLKPAPTRKPKRRRRKTK